MKKTFCCFIFAKGSIKDIWQGPNPVNTRCCFNVCFNVDRMSYDVICTTSYRPLNDVVCLQRNTLLGLDVDFSFTFKLIYFEGKFPEMFMNVF